jgi:hypothetical protein
MKKTFFIILLGLLISSSGIAQNKKDSTLTDSTAIISVKDYVNFYNAIIAQLPTSQGLPIIQYWQQLIQLREREWQFNHSKIKKNDKQ